MVSSSRTRFFMSGERSFKAKRHRLQVRLGGQKNGYLLDTDLFYSPAPEAGVSLTPSGRLKKVTSGSPVSILSSALRQTWFEWITER